MSSPIFCLHQVYIPLMKFLAEPYQVIFAWTVAFSVLEPLVTFVNYALFADVLKPVYSVYGNTSPFIVALSEYIYYTAIFVKTMYVYKYFLGQPTYYPRRGVQSDYIRFLVTYVTIQLMADVVWGSLFRYARKDVEFFESATKYSREIGVAVIARTSAFGLGMMVATELMFRHVSDLHAIGFLVFGIFIATASSFEKK
jgi:hypothetical protein